MDITPEQLEAALVAAEGRVKGLQQTIDSQATQIADLQKKSLTDDQVARLIALGTPTTK